MKRNEVLNHIKEDLLEKLKHRWLERGETDKWAEFTANELLDMIEGFGILPPLCEESIGQHNVSTIEAMLDSVMYDFKWDKENE